MIFPVFESLRFPNDISRHCSILFLLELDHKLLQMHFLVFVWKTNDVCNTVTSFASLVKLSQLLCFPFQMDLYSVEYWKNWKKNYKYTESCVDLEEDKNVKVLNRFQEERRLAKLAQKLRNEKLQANYEQSLMEKEAKEKAYQLKMNPALSTKRKTYQGFISNSHMKSDSFLDRGYSAVRSETSTVSLQPVERISKFVPAKDSPKMATFGQSTRKDWEVKTTKDRMQAGPGSYSLENVGALSEHANASTSTFSNASKMQTSSNETPGAVYSPHYDAIKRTAAAIQFPSAERLGEQQVESTPGPKYNIPSGFHKMNPLPDAVMEVSLGQQDPTYQESPAQVEFGFGCSIQEHIQYGKVSGLIIQLLYHVC